jgi:two-component system, NarL family, captular synthesis response regulator RcsB
MKKRVLVVMDFESQNIFVNKIIENKLSFHAIAANNCDDAYLKIKEAIHKKTPYDLLISDLNFYDEDLEIKLKSGEELIAITREIQPDIKIIVFSGDVKHLRKKSLFKDHNIDAFITKGGEGGINLEKSIRAIAFKKK